MTAERKLSEEALRALQGLSSLPDNEWRAIQLWLSTFYTFQLEWLLDFNRFSLILKSRQIGCSHTIAGAAVLWGMLGETTTIISLGQREADEVLDKASKHAQALVKFGSSWAAAKRAKSRELELMSGGRIMSLPNSSAGRSFSGNVILDEVAYYDHPEEVWDGAGGTALHGYRIRVLSTPNGAGDFWYGLWSDPLERSTRAMVASRHGRTARRLVSARKLRREWAVLCCWCWSCRARCIRSERRVHRSRTHAGTCC